MIKGHQNISAETLTKDNKTLGYFFRLILPRIRLKLTGVIPK